MDLNNPNNCKTSDLVPNLSTYQLDNEELMHISETQRNKDENFYQYTQPHSTGFGSELNKGFSQNTSLNPGRSCFEETTHEKSPSWPVTTHSKPTYETYTVALSRLSQSWSYSTPMLAECKSLPSANQGNTRLFENRGSRVMFGEGHAGSKPFRKPKSLMQFNEFYNSKPGYPPPRLDSDGHNLGDAEYNVPSPPERDIPASKTVNERATNKSISTHSQQTSPVSPSMLNWPHISASASSGNLHRDTHNFPLDEMQKKMPFTSEMEKMNSPKSKTERDSKVHSSLGVTPLIISGEKYTSNNNFKSGDLKNISTSSSTYIIKQTPYYNTSTQTELVFPDAEDLPNLGVSIESSRMKTKNAGTQVALVKDAFKTPENVSQRTSSADNKETQSNLSPNKNLSPYGIPTEVQGDLNMNYSRSYQPPSRSVELRDDAFADPTNDEFKNSESLLIEKRDYIGDMNPLKFNKESNEQVKQRSASESEVKRPVTMENLLSSYQDYIPSTAPILRKLSEELYMQAYRQGNVPAISTSSNLPAPQESLVRDTRHTDSNSSLVIKDTPSSRFSFPNQPATSWEAPISSLSTNLYSSNQDATDFLESDTIQSQESQPVDNFQNFKLPKNENKSNMYKVQNFGTNYGSDKNLASSSSIHSEQTSNYIVPQKIPSPMQGSFATLNESKFKAFHSSTSVLDDKKSPYMREKPSFYSSTYELDPNRVRQGIVNTSQTDIKKSTYNQNRSSFQKSVSEVDNKKNVHSKDRLSFPGNQRSQSWKPLEGKSHSFSALPEQKVSTTQITATRRPSMKKAFGMYDETEAALSERSLLNYKRNSLGSPDMIDVPKHEHTFRKPYMKGLAESGQVLHEEDLNNSTQGWPTYSVAHTRSESLPLSGERSDDNVFAVPQGVPKKSQPHHRNNNNNRTLSETMYTMRGYRSNVDVTSSQNSGMSSNYMPSFSGKGNTYQFLDPNSDSYERLAQNSRRRSYTSNDQVFKKSISGVPVNTRLYGMQQHGVQLKQNQQHGNNNNNNNNNCNNNEIDARNMHSDYMDMTGRFQEQTKHPAERSRAWSQMLDTGTPYSSTAVAFGSDKDLNSPEHSPLEMNMDSKQALLSSSVPSVVEYQNVAKKGGTQTSPEDKLGVDFDLPPALPPRIYRLSSMDSLAMSTPKSSSGEQKMEHYNEYSKSNQDPIYGHSRRKQKYAEEVRAQAKRFTEQSRGMCIVKTTPKMGFAEQTKVVPLVETLQIAVPLKPLDKDGKRSPKCRFSPEMTADTTEPEYPRDSYASYRSQQNHRSVGVYKRSKSTLDTTRLGDQDDGEKIRTSPSCGWKSEDNLGPVGFQSRASSEQCLAEIDHVADRFYLPLSSSTVSLPTDADTTRAETCDPNQEKDLDNLISVKQRVKKFEGSKPEEAKSTPKEEMRVKPSPPPVPAKPKALLQRISSDIHFERKKQLRGKQQVADDGENIGSQEKTYGVADDIRLQSGYGDVLESHISPTVQQKLSPKQYSLPPKSRPLVTCDSKGHESGDQHSNVSLENSTESQQLPFFSSSSESRHLPLKQSMVSNFPSASQTPSSSTVSITNITPEYHMSYLQQNKKPSVMPVTSIHPLNFHLSLNCSDDQDSQETCEPAAPVSNIVEPKSKFQSNHNSFCRKNPENDDINYFKEQSIVSSLQDGISINQDGSRIVVSSSVRKDSTDYYSQHPQMSKQEHNENLPANANISNNNLNNDSNNNINNIINNKNKSTINISCKNNNIDNNTNDNNLNGNNTSRSNIIGSGVNNNNNNHSGNDNEVIGKSDVPGHADTKKEFKISCHSRQPSQEELEFEVKAKELSQELKDDDKNLLQVLNPNNKKAIDFVEDLWENTVYGCQQIPTKLSKHGGEISAESSNQGSNKELPQESPQNIPDSCKESETCSENEENALLQKKEGLRISLMKKLEVLQEAKQSVEKEIMEINCLGEKIANNFDASCENSQEKNKYKSFLEDREMVIKLLLKLSVLLARAENSVQCLPENAEARKKALAIEKRDKLSSQHEEAKQLKSDIDRRQEQITNILKQYLSDEDLRDYHYFLSMKSRLIIESQELEDKIFLGQEQLSALKRSIPTPYLS